jgi:hypothetical protein
MYIRYRTYLYVISMYRKDIEIVTRRSYFTSQSHFFVSVNEALCINFPPNIVSFSYIQMSPWRRGIAERHACAQSDRLCYVFMTKALFRCVTHRYIEQSNVLFCFRSVPLPTEPFSRRCPLALFIASIWRSYTWPTRQQYDNMAEHEL